MVATFPGDEALGSALLDLLPAEPCALSLRRFPDQESYVRVLAPVADREIVVSCTLVHPDPKLVPLYLLCRTLRQLGARRVLLATPYLPYMRQDRAFHPGEALSAQQLAGWISGFVDGLATVEPHLHRIARLDEIYTIPYVAVSAAAAIAGWLREQVARPLLVGPDAESRPWIEALAQHLGCASVVLHKIRHDDQHVEIALPDLPQQTDCTPVLVDDIISTGGTLRAAIQHLRSAGLAPPVCIGVHALFGREVEDALRSVGAARVVSCNSIAHPSNAIDIRPDLAAALRALLSRPR